jgi:hypothetical protein
MLEYSENMHQSMSQRSSKSKNASIHIKKYYSSKKGNFRYLIKLSRSEDIAGAAIGICGSVEPAEITAQQHWFALCHTSLWKTIF